jgi:hypothetical protein
MGNGGDCAATPARHRTQGALMGPIELPLAQASQDTVAVERGEDMTQQLLPGRATAAKKRWA